MKELSQHSKVKIAGRLAVVLFGLVILLQLLLAVGILPVSMAWGGREAELTSRLRLASLGAMVLLAGFAYVIARKANLVGSKPPSLIIKILSWLITAYLGLNTLGNFTSLSTGEKWLFGPITLVLVICCFIVSISKSGSQIIKSED